MEFILPKLIPFFMSPPKGMLQFLIPARNKVVLFLFFLLLFGFTFARMRNNYVHTCHRKGKVSAKLFLILQYIGGMKV